MHYGDPEVGIPLCDEDDDAVTELVRAVTCRKCLQRLISIGKEAAEQLGKL